MGVTAEMLMMGLFLAAYMTLAALFLAALETRRFSTRRLLLATTAAAIAIGLMVALIRGGR